jgi:DNA replication protein DnaC
MLSHTTRDRLAELKLYGMASALEEQLAMADIAELSFEERLGLLVERETTERASRQLTARLRKAKLREQAAIEDIDWRTRRGLDKGQILRLASCQWIADHRNVLVTGKAGVGKTFLACSLGHKACREGYSALYVRMPRLFAALALARGDGSYEKLLRSYARTDVLILDDWGLAPIGATERRDLLEILEDRYDRRSTLVASQLPVDTWYEVIGDPTLADAILDRLVHAAYRIPVEGDSMRAKRAKKPPSTTLEHSTEGD